MTDNQQILPKRGTLVNGIGVDVYPGMKDFSLWPRKPAECRTIKKKYFMIEGKAAKRKTRISMKRKGTGFGLN